MKYRNYYCTPKYSDGDKIYYGEVGGVPDIPMIEAANLDDFERLFHQAVDDYLDGRREEKPQTKWGLIIAIAVVALLLVAAIATCPKKEQHVAFLADRVSTIVSEELEQQGGGGDLAPLGLLIGNAIIAPAVNNSLTVNDYFLFSVGKLSQEGKDTTVSIGAFGRIFTASKERMKQILQDNQYFNDYIDLLK